jgi:hypothetical protein
MPALATYSKAHIRATSSKDYSTPEPDEVEAYARSLAPELCNIFEAAMRLKFPSFRLDYKSKPTDSIEDGLADLAYHFVSACEREREA